MTTREYDSRGADYIAGRPGFPSAVVDVIAELTGIRAPADVVDVGAGTGALSRVMADAGYRVVAVEPNEDMLRAAYTASIGARCATANAAVVAGDVVVNDVQWLEGSAERLPIADASVDLWTAAQAFHWFDADTSGAEARRVLRPSGAVALVWNHLDMKHAPSQALRALLVRHERKGAARGTMSREKLTRFLGHDAWQTRWLEQEHVLHRDAFLARVFSSDLVPARNDDGAARLIEDAGAAFTAHASNDVIGIRYEVEVVCATLR